jgi:hypothetical protein
MIEAIVIFLFFAILPSIGIIVLENRRINREIDKVDEWIKKQNNNDKCEL